MEMKTTRLWFILILSLIVSTTLWIIILRPYPFDMGCNPSEGDFYHRAPDNTYDVFVSQILKPKDGYGVVAFPLCPSYGGDLHGEWFYILNLTFETSHWYYVDLKDNIIVSAKGQ